MSQFFALRLKHILFDSGPNLRCRSIHVPEKRFPASVLFAQRSFLHVQLSQGLANVCLGWLIQAVFYL